MQAAFDDAVKASQDRERQKNEGQAYANDIIPRARGMASRLLQEADGYNASVVQRAEGDASRFKQILVEYTKAPGGHARAAVSRHDAIGARQLEQGAGRPEIGPSNLLYLPLDQLLKQGHVPAPGATVGADATRPAAPAADAAVTMDPARSRDLSRDRGTSR